jgi:hypothetical protein
MRGCKGVRLGCLSDWLVTHVINERIFFESRLKEASRIFTENCLWFALTLRISIYCTYRIRKLADFLGDISAFALIL